MNLIAISAYITVEQKLYLNNRKRDMPSISSLFRDFLDTLMENEINEKTKKIE